jgi:hypothetical protein
MDCQRRTYNGFRTRILILAAAMTPACAPGPQPAALISVHGRVTLNGGSWPNPGILTFEPIDPKDAESKIGVAAFDTEGTFRAISRDLREGLHPGYYKVTVNCWQIVPASGEEGGAPVLAEYVPEAYRQASSTRLSLVLEPDDGETEVLLDVTSR